MRSWKGTNYEPGNFSAYFLYYFVLLLALPLFRKQISARACAMLWVIPNYLYITLPNYMRLPGPLLVISVPEELSLILKHEIIHIAREDADAKFFLVFCMAMCWFNPLMWIAMKKSAEDMELSCDETVLLDADAGTRKKYASLLLDTAGDDRGFTTCLSASASGMRYRLKSIVKPVKRRNGALIVGLVFFLLCMTSGYVSLVYGGATGAEIIYQSGDYSGYHLWSVCRSGDDYSSTYDDFAYDVTDEAAFHEYLAGLTLAEFTGNYSFSESSKEFIYLLDTPDGTLGIDLCDNYMRLTYLGDELEQVGYYIPEGVDWEYLGTAIVEREE